MLQLQTGIWWVDDDAVVGQALKNLSQVVLVFLGACTGDQEVIYVCTTIM